MDSTDSAARRARLQRTIENEIVPRLLFSHRVGPLSPAVASAVSQSLSEEDVERFVAAVRGVDDTRAHDYVRELLDTGTTIDAVYLDLISPAARRLGELWETDECDFVEVTLSMGRMQRMLRDLSQVFLSDAGRTETVGSILLTCVPGEQHTLGIIMVGEFLIRDGWRVLVGAPWTENDLLEMVNAEWYDVIGFSVGCESRISVLKREIRRLREVSRNPEVKVMVGGRVFNEDQLLVNRVGADTAATDAREAPAAARSMLALTKQSKRMVARQEDIGAHGAFRETLRLD